MADFVKGSLINVWEVEERKNATTGEVFDGRSTAQLLSKTGDRFTLETFYFEQAQAPKLRQLSGKEVLVPVTVRINRKTNAVAKYTVDDEEIQVIGDAQLSIHEKPQRPAAAQRTAAE
jgi:hypothetical protein